MLDRPTIVRLSEVLAIACAMFGQPVVCTAYIYILRMLVTYMMEWRPCFFSRRQHSFTDSDTSFVGSNTQRRICSLHWLDKQQVKMLWIRIQSISFQRRGKGWKRFIAGYCYFLLFFTFYLFIIFFRCHLSNTLSSIDVLCSRITADIDVIYFKTIAFIVLVSSPSSSLSSSLS